ncbi:MAG TPA: hypothetical protein VMU90_14055 [Solirubrobacteraceae bacterium]|nr:hypothetical protein [Solirubrobacteraceae bacterium]
MRIVLAGGVGAMPFAGVAWQVLQYLEGFRRLGHDVFYLEDTQRWPYDPVQDTVCDDAGPAIAYVARLMERVGLQRAWAYRDVAQGALHGVTEEALVRTLCDADALINLSGVMVLREEHLCVPTRIYLETDPVLPQIEVAQGRDFTIEFLGAHTHHFSYGENFGSADCGVPVERFHYHPTRPPVILDWWDGGGSPTLDGRAFTTVANWRQTSKDIVWRGRNLTWSKDVQFMRLLDLPKRVEPPIELALSLGDEQVAERLRHAGWRVRPAGPLSKDIDAYRTFIVGSAGEFSVAKEQNVALRSGWFSDRTASYLAAGRPAIVQDTGFGCALPTGEGLLAFSTIEEAQAAFAAVQSDYPHHCRAARAIASEYLRAETVLGELLTCAC